MKISGIIEARMGSTRLPGKVLLPLGGKPVLERLIERVSMAKYLDDIVVATSSKENDDPIVELCEKLGVNVYRGSENDVMARVLGAAQNSSTDIICELMGDSPFTDPVLIDLAIAAHLAGKYDYTSNFLFENILPMGFAVQVFSTSLLDDVAKLTQDPIDRVHVSCFIYHNPKMFRLQAAPVNPQLAGPGIRLCLDTNEDYQLITKVFQELHEENEYLPAYEIIRYVRERPDLLKINASVRQKGIDEG